MAHDVLWHGEPAGPQPPVPFLALYLVLSHSWDRCIVLSQTWLNWAQDMAEGRFEGLCTVGPAGAMAALMGAYWSCLAACRALPLPSKSALPFEVLGFPRYSRECPTAMASPTSRSHPPLALRVASVMQLSNSC